MRTVFATGILLALATLVSAQEYQPAKATDKHEALQKEIGTWKAEATWWPKGADGPAVKSTGTETNRIIGDGLWVVREYVGKVQGHPYEASGHYGYDPKTDKYLGTWVDSRTHNVTIMEGTYDPKTESLEMISETEGRDGAVVIGRSVTRYVDDGKKEFIMFIELPSGEKVKWMEIHYTKK